VSDPHILRETNYCSVMHEGPWSNGRPSCRAAGRFMDTEGRVVCQRCAAGLVVTKLTDLPKLIGIVDQLIVKKAALTDGERAVLGTLVYMMPEKDDDA
jgi:hypothetical protein